MKAGDIGARVCPRCGQSFAAGWLGVHPRCFLYRLRLAVGVLALGVVVPLATMPWRGTAPAAPLPTDTAGHDAPPAVPRTIDASTWPATLAVAALGANLRASPSADAAKVRELKRGDTLRWLGYESGFVHVQGAEGDTGWISETVLITTASLARLQGLTAADYVKSRGNGAEVGAVAQQVESRQPRVAQARSLMLRDPAAAEAALRDTASLQAITASSDSEAERWYAWSARAAEKADDFQAAASEWMAAINADPANPEPHGAYGVVCLRLKRFDHAKVAAHMMQLLAPASTLTWFLTGTTDALADRQDDAVAAYGMALRLAKNPPATRRALGDWARTLQDARVTAAVNAALARPG